MACNPKLIIADEPTTALDVTIQAQILELMQGLKNQLNTSIIMITHDLGVIANVLPRIVVMYGGGCVAETGTTRDILFAQAPVHMGSAALHTQGADGRNPFQTPANTRHAA